MGFIVIIEDELGRTRLPGVCSGQHAMNRAADQRNLTIPGYGRRMRRAGVMSLDDWKAAASMIDALELAELS